MKAKRCKHCELAASEGGGPTESIFSCRAEDCWVTGTTNHNKAAGCGLVCQPITAYVGHISWQPSVATLAAASGGIVIWYS